MDLDLDHYTNQELMDMAHLSYPLTSEGVEQQTQPLIDSAATPEYATFYTGMQQRLLTLTGNDQGKQWYQYEALPQDDYQQESKITQRAQKVDVFQNDHAPMNRQQVATTDTYALPVKQDSLNPNLKNVIKRFVNLDSQFRQYTSGVDSMSTCYTCDLSDTLTNVLKLSLYSYQIPCSWYTVDITYGNTCCWITDGAAATTVIPLSISPGNYTASTLVTALQDAMSAAGLQNASITYNACNGLCTWNLWGAVTAEGVVIQEGWRLVWYDFTSVLQCGTSCSSSSTNHYFNSTLGWILGFRVP